MFEMPDEIRKWLFSVFRKCNLRLSEKITNNPNTPETSLDVTFIEYLSGFSSPITFGPMWTVRIETSFIGGRRHFYGWEIADIGVLVLFRIGGKIVRKKVALLQSKRLYPIKGVVEEEIREDMIIGISVLLRDELKSVPISRIIDYEFNSKSKYKALKSKDKQFKAISGWIDETNVPVHYMFYNPWTIPVHQKVPLLKYVKPPGVCELGVRIISSDLIHQLLNKKKRYYSPNIGEMRTLLPKPHTWASNAYGYRLESFFANLIDCKEGYVFESAQDISIDRLFYRKDAMLSAAIAITVELNE